MGRLRAEMRPSAPACAREAVAGGVRGEPSPVGNGGYAPPRTLPRRVDGA